MISNIKKIPYLPGDISLQKYVPLLNNNCLVAVYFKILTPDI